MAQPEQVPFNQKSNVLRHLKILIGCRFALMTAALCAVASGHLAIGAEPMVALENPYLPNAWQIHERVICGGQPDGENGFRALRELGVRTVISVDGLRPDVETARRYDLQYLHLPHGYDGVPEQRATELAKAVRDLPGPIYIHCHHGKHRSPVAAVVACIGAGLIPPASARTALETAGTSLDYRGLYEAAEAARPIAAEVLDALKAEFPQSVDPPPLVQVMTKLEHQLTHLEALAARPSKVIPAEDALLLKELFTELGRESSSGQSPEPYLELIHTSRQESARLETLLRADDSGSRGASWRSAVSARVTGIRTHCHSCHRRFRD